MVKILLQAPPHNLRNLKRKFNYESVTCPETSQIQVKKKMFI
jgi:hypothetical protein